MMLIELFGLLLHQELLDSRNLVMKNGNDGDSKNFVWQSFDYPCNTLLIGIKLVWNRVTDLDHYLSSRMIKHQLSLTCLTRIINWLSLD